MLLIPLCQNRRMNILITCIASRFQCQEKKKRSIADYTGWPPKPERETFHNMWMQ